MEEDAESKYPGVIRWTFERCGGIFRQRTKSSPGERASTFRRDLHLPCPAWLKERLASVDENLESNVSSVCLYGLAHLREGGLFESALTPLSEEAMLQWTYLHCPRNFCWGQVDKVWRLRSPCEIFSQHPTAPRTMRRMRVQDDVMKVQRGPGLIIPVLPDGRFDIVHRGQDLRLTLEELVDQARSGCGIDGEDPSAQLGIMLPHCLAELVCRSRWREVGSLSRWGPVFATWPSEDWSNSNERQWIHDKESSFWESTPTEDLLLPRVFQHMASSLRDLGRNLPGDRHEELRTILEWMDDCQTAVGGLSQQALRWNWDSRPGGGKGRAQLASEALFSAFLASRNMSSKGKEDMEQTVKGWIDSLIPPALRAAVHLTMKPSSLPSKETIREAQLTIDAAMCLQARKNDIFANAASYLWWDSTPHGHDWLLSQIHSVRHCNLAETFDTARALLASTQNQSGRAAESEQVKQKANFVSRQISAHTFLPVALGLRSSGMANKVAALFHALFLETGSLQGIERFCESVVSVTTDMGVESGVCDFHALNVADFLPDWLLPPEVEADGAEEAPPAPDLAWHAAWLLQNAIPVPGMLHIVSNILTDAHSKLSHWDIFHGQLKDLGKLLCHAPRRDRFIRMCVKGKHWDNMIDLIDVAFPTMYEKRWHHVLQLGKKVQSVWAILKDCWKPRLYQEGHSGEDGRDQVADDEFSVDAVSKCLADQMFPAYLAMVVEIDRVAEGLGSWAEGCPCHEAATSKIVSSSKRRKVIAKLCGTTGMNRAGGDGCRLAGKRAWELALGKVRDIISKGCRLGMSKLTVDWKPSLRDDQWITIANDYAAAESFIAADLALKLNFWEKLP